jgi:hypothetical protein
MDAPFHQMVAAWSGFYTFIGAASATLLGLLFVAVSLRLNLFHQVQVEDVRDYSVQALGQFLALVLISALFLFPDQQPWGIGVPVALLATLGIIWQVHVWRKSIRVNAPNDPSARSRTALYTCTLVLYAGLLIVGIAISRDVSWAFLWLAILSLALLTAAVVGAWSLLSHATPS